MTLIKKKFDNVKKSMRDIAAVDLRMVDIAHFVIMYMDIDVHLCGSYHEAFVAIQQKKPLLIVCKQGKCFMPSWMFGVMPHEHMFDDWNDMLQGCLDDPQSSANHLVLGMDLNQRREARGNTKQKIPTWV